MSLLHDVYTALLSGLAYKIGNEIHWHDEYGHPITVEPIDVESESYVVRYYGEDGSLEWEENYHQNQLHCKSFRWYSNGQKFLEEGYYQDQLHGKYIRRHKDGTFWYEQHYIDGYLATREE